MPGQDSFDFAILRIVPHVEREEFVNVGVLLFCRRRHFLRARIDLDAVRARLMSLAPHLDLNMVRAQLDLIPLICEGGPAAGPLSQLDESQRFHWLVAPRSTIVQVSPVHSGITSEPQQALDDLFEKLVSFKG